LSHIVIIPFDTVGKLNTVFELSQRLQKASHRVSIVGASGFRKAAEARGFPFFAAGDGVSRPKQHIEKANPLRFFQVPEKQIDAAIDALGMQGFTELLTELVPDLILIDVEQHKYIISAVPTGIPVALLSTLASLFKHPALPPAHLGVIPGIGLKGTRLGIELLWLRFRLWKWLRRLLYRVKNAGLDMLSVLRYHARRTGFDFRTEVDLNQWLIPIVYRNLPVLVFMTREFDFPHTHIKHYYHVGALINLNRREVVKIDDSDNKRLNELIAQHQNSPKPRKLIYCAFGAYFQGNDTRFWMQLVRSLNENTAWDIIFGLGGRLDPSRLGELPPNIHAFKWVPQVRVLGFADCAIIHGGISSINECILSGVPMVVFPFDVNDQHGNAARVAYHKVGVVGNRHHDDSNAIRNHVKTILDDPLYASRVRQMREHFDRYLHDNTAVNTVAALLSKAKAPSR
jgi:UDP:flavonoid glycosyltransferase YjiC (YdhE family)